MALTTEDVKRLINEIAAVDIEEEDVPQDKVEGLGYMIWLLARYVTEVTE